MRNELLQLKEKLKSINLRVRGDERLTQSYYQNQNFDINHSAGLQKRSKSTINILHQDGDFDDGMEEECMDPMVVRSNMKEHKHDIDGSSDNRRMLTDSMVREHGYPRGTIEVET